MQPNMSDESIISDACEALCNISDNDESIDKISAGGGGIETILQAGCGTLLNIVPNAKNVVKVSSCGGVEIIFQEMKKPSKIAHT